MSEKNPHHMWRRFTPITNNVEPLAKLVAEKDLSNEDIVLILKSLKINHRLQTTKQLAMQLTDKNGLQECYKWDIDKICSDYTNQNYETCFKRTQELIGQLENIAACAWREYVKTSDSTDKT